MRICKNIMISLLLTYIMNGLWCADISQFARYLGNILVMMISWYVIEEIDSRFIQKEEK